MGGGFLDSGVLDTLGYMFYLCFVSKSRRGGKIMEENDVRLIRKLVPHNKELKKLWDEHLEYEKKLEKYSERRYFSTEDELRRKEIQKLKLAGRDRIEEILHKRRGK